MDKLKRYSLNELVDVRDGTHDSPKYVDDGFPLITSKNLIDGRVDFENVNFITEIDYNSINKRSKVDEGDILYSMIGSIGNFAIVNFEPRFAIKNVALIKFKNSSLSSKYFIHYIKSNEFTSQIEKQSKGGTQKFVTLKILRSIQIPLPPLPQQQKIANILDAADELRQNDKALLAKYDELKQALFLDMFGDPVNNPKGWEVIKLKEISTKIHSGNTPKGGSEVYVEEGITFFRSQNVWKNRLVYEDIAFIDQATHDKMMKSSLKHKDILMTKTGRINTENSSLGRAAIYLGEDDKANVNGHVYLIRLKKDIINEFVLHILTTKEYRGHIRSVCVGGIDKRQLNKDHLENFPIINPPIELQNQFTKIVAQIEEQKAIVQKSLEKSEELFNSLLQKAFKGGLL
ncbi:restriction endonuclease subunit S [Flavobacterium sp. M31R6]|uniref:restriction endonuclease subunit S n=1 Tax=Flavobacterium sp. M31R6 TaxID=2739062 RepID=UPI0015680CF1|nr:restriction endonuclease subunit S [Flavobacterium sp. M31R6]QKJ63332.1 restriction endonuclease subunit S [Flavobacterium sp. M31R6]